MFIVVPLGHEELEAYAVCFNRTVMKSNSKRIATEKRKT